MSIKEWIEGERPREMLIKNGSESLSISKLLAIILRTGNEGTNAEELARKVLNRFRTLRAIDATTIDELCSIEGIGPAKAAQLKSSFELGKRLYREEAEKTERLKGPEDAIAYVSRYYGPYLRDAMKESFHIILLNTKNKPLRNIEISRGSSDTSIVDPKEIIRQATLNSASSLLLVHNHPSGEAEPSEEDIKTTKLITEACSLVGVNVLDHIIIGKNKGDYLSFAKEGLLEQTPSP